MEILIFLTIIFILSSVNLSTQYLSNYKNLEFNKMIIWVHHIFGVIIQNLQG